MADHPTPITAAELLKFANLRAGLPEVTSRQLLRKAANTIDQVTRERDEAREKLARVHDKGCPAIADDDSDYEYLDDAGMCACGASANADAKLYAELAALRQSLAQSEKHIEMLNAAIRSHVDAAKIFQVGGELSNKLALGDSTVVDGMEWLLKERLTLIESLAQCEQRAQEMREAHFRSFCDGWLANAARTLEGRLKFASAEEGYEAFNRTSENVNLLPACLCTTKDGCTTHVVRKGANGRCDCGQASFIASPSPTPERPQDKNV